MNKASLWTRARHATVLSLALAVCFAGVSFGPLGPYLNETLYLLPIQKLRLLIGTAPKPDPRLRIVLLEDRSFKRLGRSPTFDEWTKIAGLLHDLGFERILFLGFQDGPASGAAAFAHALIHGAADAISGVNLRAAPVESLPEHFFLSAPGAGSHRERASFLLGPETANFAAVDRLGLVNLPEDLRMPALRAVGPDLVIPNIGLYATPGLRWESGHLRDDRGEIPLPWDDNFYVNYLDYHEVLQHAVAVSSFYTPDHQSVTDGLGDHTRAVLKGGSVALLVPDAGTGARFVNTPSGKAPSFLAAASVANSSLSREFLFEPFAPLPVVAGWTLLMGVVLGWRRRRGADLIAGLALLALALGPAAAFLAAGLIFPVIPMALVTVAGGGVALSDRLLQGFRRRIELQRDLELGSAVQSTLFSGNVSGQFGPWEYRLVFEPYGPMSGDWHQVYATPNDAPRAFRVLAIGDVVGKGPGAALCTAAISAIWVALAEKWDHGELDPELIVRTLHRTILRTFKDPQNSTLSLAVLTEDEAMILSYGAPPWYRVKVGNQATRIPMKARNPLGMEDRFAAPDIQRLKAGDLDGETIVAYTDGLLDVGKSRQKFQELIASHAIATGPDGDFRAVESCMRVAGVGFTLPDDKTLLMIRCAARAPAVPLARTS